jgi:MFS superfamily sulfate permease-like transporter
MWVAFNMVKPAEIRQVLAHNRFHVFLMLLTAAMVIITDFMTGVLSGMVVYGLLFRFFDRPVAAGIAVTQDTSPEEAERERAGLHPEPESVS